MANETKLDSLSVFFPCFNEEKNLKPMVDGFMAVLPQITSRFEIIIINDGSRDHTGAVADTLAAGNPHLKVIHHATNLGYGSSLRTGIQAAQYDWTFFTDGDCQFDPKDLKSFVPFTTEYPAIIGFRRERAEGFSRNLNARVFKLFIDLLFRVHVYDIDCAFKLIKTDILQSLPLISTGAMISSEILYRLKKKHLPLKQLPVKHFPRTWGKPTGSNLRVIFRAGYEALKLYLTMKLNFPL